MNKEDKKEIVEEGKAEVKENKKETKVEKKASKKDFMYLSLKPKNAEELDKERYQKMVLPHAPEGYCKTAIRTLEKEMPIHLIDGILFADPRFGDIVRQLEIQDFIKG